MQALLPKLKLFKLIFRKKCYICTQTTGNNYETFTSYYGLPVYRKLLQCRTEQVIIQGDHDKLVADVQLPDVMPKNCPIVMLCHGFTANRNGELLCGIADELEKRGIASIRFDFNGHGESEGDFQQMTVPNEIEDAMHVYNWVKADGRFGKVGIAGHSQGGVVTSMLAGKLGKKAFRGGVVLLAPAGVIRDDAIRGTVAGQPVGEGDPLDPPEYVEVWGHHLRRRDNQGNSSPLYHPVWHEPHANPVASCPGHRVLPIF